MPSPLSLLLLLLSLLRAAESCFAQNELRMTIGERVVFPSRCEEEVAFAIINPGLPDGLSLIPGGTIEGASFQRSPRSLYQVHLVLQSGRVVSREVYISVSDTPSGCDYGFTTLSFPVNRRVTYQLFCTDYPTMVNTTGLPDFITLDSKTGAITGMATASSANSQKLTLILINEAGSQELVLTVSSQKFAALKDGISVRVTPPQAGNYNPYSIQNQIDSEALSLYNTILPTFNFTCGAGSSCPQTGNRTSNVYIQYRSVVQIANEGRYSFSIQCSTYCFFYLDQENTRTPTVISYPGSTISYPSVLLSSGLHSIDIFDYAVSAPRISVEIAKEGSDEPLSDLIYRHSPGMISSVVYPSELVVLHGQPMRVAPTELKGNVETIDKGDASGAFSWLTIDSAGVLSGTPTEVHDRAELKVTVRNSVNRQVSTIAITVVDETSIHLGLMGTFYKTHTTSCSDSLIIPSSSLAVHSVVSSSLDHSVESGPFSFLSPDFVVDFISEWTGYVNVRRLMTYTFYLTAVDMVEMYLNGEQILNSSVCGYKTSQSSPVLLAEGYHPVVIRQKKAHESLKNAIQLYWSSGADSMKIVSDLAYLPQQELSYSNQISRYQNGKPITENTPVLLHPTRKYNQFEVSPRLPLGLVLDSSTGTISGTLREAANFLHRYTITAHGSTSETIQTVLRLRFVSLTAPSTLVYPEILGQSHSRVSVTPEAAYVENGYFQMTPVSGEVSIHHSNGKIDGYFTMIPFNVMVIYYNEMGFSSLALPTSMSACQSGVKLTLEYWTNDRDTVVSVAASNGFLYQLGSHQESHKYVIPVCSSETSFVVSLSSSFGGGHYTLRLPSGSVYSESMWTYDSPALISVSSVETAVPIVSYRFDPLPIVGSTWIAYAIAKNGATEWSCSDCPSSLAIDKLNGRIEGSFPSAGSVTLTIVAKNSFGPTTFSLTVNAYACSLDFYSLRIHSFPVASPYSVIQQLELPMSKRVITTLIEDRPHLWVFCVPKKELTLSATLLGSSDASVVASMFVLESSVFLGHILLDRENPKDSITLRDSTSSEASHWRINHAYVKDWQKYDVKWPSYPLGFFPTVKPGVMTHCYQKKVYLSRDEKLIYHIFKVHFMGAIAMYVNGILQYSYLLPPAFDSTTPPTETTLVKQYKVIKIQNSNLIIGGNILSFEMHYQYTSESADPFFIEYTSETSVDACMRMTTASSKAQYVPPTGPFSDLSPTFIADGNFGNEWVAYSSPMPNYTFWMMNEAVAFNRLTIGMPSFCCNRDITSFDVYGVNDYTSAAASKLTLLYSMTDYDYKCTILQGDGSGRDPRNKPVDFDFNNNKAYEGFTFIAKGYKGGDNGVCSLTNYMALSELYIQICRQTATCAATDIIPEGYIGARYTLPCAPGLPLRQTYECKSSGWILLEGDCSEGAEISFPLTQVNAYRGIAFSAKPVIRGAFRTLSTTELPEGLSFSSVTGEIYGTVSANASTPSSVTVTGTKWNGDKATSTMTLSYFDSLCPSRDEFLATPPQSTTAKSCPSSMMGVITSDCVYSGNLLSFANLQYQCYSTNKPRCAIPSTVTTSFNSEVHFEPLCLDPATVMSATVSPALPSGLYLSSNGKVSGVANELMSGRVFIFVLTTSAGSITLQSEFTVTPANGECSYGLTKIISHPDPISLDLTCDEVPQFAELLESSVPGSFEFHPLTGRIVLSSSATFDPMTLHIRVRSGLRQQIVALEVFGSSTIRGLNNRLVGEVSGQSSAVIAEVYADYRKAWSVETGLKFSSKQSIYAPDNWNAFSFDGAYSYTLISGGTTSLNNFYLISVNGSICLNSGSIIQLHTVSDDRSFVYVGDLENALMHTEVYNLWVNGTVSLPAGCHPFVAVGVEGEGVFSYHLQWSSGNGKVVIPSSNFAIPIPLVRNVRFARSEYTYVLSETVRVVPLFEGTAASWTIDLTPLPAGLAFSDGILSGVVQGTLSHRKVIVTAVHSSGSQSSGSFYLTVSSTETLNAGLVAQYHTISSVVCGSVPVVTDATLFVSQVEESPTHNFTHQRWSGVPISMMHSFYSSWSGYINVTVSGQYTFALHAPGHATLLIGTTKRSNVACGVSSDLEVRNTFVGAKTIYVKIEYWKQAADTFNGLEFLWRQNDSAPYIAVPPSALFHMPQSSFYYSMSRSTFELGERVSWSPFFDGADSQASSSFVVSPALPDSLVLSETTGIIQGRIPDAESLLQSQYIVTHGLLTAKLLTFVEPQGSSDLVVEYDSLNGFVGHSLSLYPIVSGERSSTDLFFSSSSDLPFGLFLENTTGRIYGTPTILFDGILHLSYSTPSNAGAAEKTVDLRTSIISRGAVSGYLIELRVTSGKVSASSLTLRKEEALSSAIYKSSALPAQDTLTIRTIVQEAGNYILELSTGPEDHFYLEFYLKGHLTYVTELFESQKRSVAIVIDDVQSPVLTYPSTPFRYGIESRMFPTQIKYGCSNFTTSSVVPFGLKLDSRTGIISGSPNSVGTHSFSVKCKNGEFSPLFTVSLSAIECDLGWMPFVMKVIGSTGEGPKMVAKLIDLDSDENVATVSGIAAGSTLVRSACVNSLSEYGLILDSSDGSVWGSGSRVELLVNNFYSVNETKSTSSSSEMKFRLYSSLVSNSSWQHVTDIVTSDWNNEFSWSNWESYYPGSFPVFTSQVNYYRSTWSSVARVSSLLGVKAKITYDGGVVVYVNGQEVYRQGMPPKTAISGTYNITVPVSVLREGVNFIAVENQIALLSLDTENHFSMDLIPILSSGRCIQKTLLSTGSPTMSISVSPSGCSSNSDNSYDGLGSTVYQCIVSSITAPVRLDWMYPSSTSETFNQLTLTTSSDCPSNDPKAFTLYGWYNSAWVSLMTTADASLPSDPRGSAVTFAVPQSKSYGGYGLHITEQREKGTGVCTTPKVKLGDFSVQMCSPPTCPSGDGYKESVSGMTVMASCKESSQSGYRQKQCTSSSAGESASWGPEDASHCLTTATSVKLPTGIQAYMTYSLDMTIERSGGVNSFSLDCPLVRGLSFDTLNGRIFGLPLEVSSGVQICTLNAIVGTSGSSLSGTFSFASYNGTYCLSQTLDGVLFPDTAVGTKAQLSCPGGQEGSISSECLAGTDSPRWSYAIRKCKTPGELYIAYPVDSVTYSVNLPIKTVLKPVIENAKGTSYRFGLQPDTLADIFNSETGEFSGTPKVAVPETLFTVTVQYTDGSGRASTSIIISVTRLSCTDNPLMPATPIGESYSGNCLTGKGTISGTCLLADPPKWTDVKDNCIPTGLSYPSSVTLYSGFNECSEPPTIEGSISSFTFHGDETHYNVSSSGSICETKGIPLNASTASVTGCKDGLCVESNEFSLSVVQLNCEGFVFTFNNSVKLFVSSAKVGDYSATHGCPNDQKGTLRFFCQPKNPPEWSVEDTCGKDITTMAPTAETGLCAEVPPWHATASGETAYRMCDGAKKGVNIRRCLQGGVWDSYEGTTCTTVPPVRVNVMLLFRVLPRTPIATLSPETYVALTLEIVKKYSLKIEDVVVQDVDLSSRAITHFNVFIQSRVTQYEVLVNLIKSSRTITVGSEEMSIDSESITIFLNDEEDPVTEPPKSTTSNSNVGAIVGGVVGGVVVVGVIIAVVMVVMKKSRPKARGANSARSKTRSRRGGSARGASARRGATARSIRGRSAAAATVPSATPSAGAGGRSSHSAQRITPMGVKAPSGLASKRNTTVTTRGSARGARGARGARSSRR